MGLLSIDASLEIPSGGIFISTGTKLATICQILQAPAQEGGDRMDTDDSAGCRSARRELRPKNGSIQPGIGPIHARLTTTIGLQHVDPPFSTTARVGLILQLELINRGATTQLK